MPGRTPAAAFKAFVDPLASALACVASCKLSASAGGRHDLDTVHYLLGNGGDRIPVGGDSRLLLQVRMKYLIIRNDQLDDGPFKIQTVAYSYTLTDSAGSGIISFHWHPDGSSHVDSPHLHIASTQLSETAVLTSRQHVPTGRVSIEQVVRALITEHGVAPKVTDWNERLTLTQGVFELYRSWS